MSLTGDKVMMALRNVPEPCSIAMRAPLDITEMGLVEDVEIDGAHVSVTLVLTDPSCVHFSALRRYITDELLALEGVESVGVTASVRALWTPDRLRPRRPRPPRQSGLPCPTS